MLVPQVLFSLMLIFQILSVVSPFVNATDAGALNAVVPAVGPPFDEALDAFTPGILGVVVPCVGAPNAVIPVDGGPAPGDVALGDNALVPGAPDYPGSQ